MKRIFYFHGLESQQGGHKIDFLSSQCLVHAPQMLYAEKDTWAISKQKVAASQPEIVVGSSMGGLMGLYSAYMQPIHLLLFNPALDRIPEYIPDWQCDGSEQKAKVRIILGKNDTEVSPHFTCEYLQKHNIKAEVKWLEIEHRIPLEVLKESFEEFTKDFDLK